MSVNPNLATLMNLVDELQDQMPEGKYLEAMNALRDLHVGRVRPPPQPVRPEPALPPALVLPEGYVRLTRADEARMASMRERRRHHENNLHPVVKAWQARYVQRAVEGMTLSQWCGLTAQQRLPLVKSALRWIFSWQTEDFNPNPDAEVCPFMSRHALGRWFNPARPLIQNYHGHENYDRARWDCVCGSKNILCKNWETHKHSDKHRKWHEEGRRVSKHWKEVMCRGVKTIKPQYNKWVEGRDDQWMDGIHEEAELLGVKIRWVVPHHPNLPHDRNEWSHPELFAGKPLDWTPPKNYTLPLMARVEEPAVFTFGAVPMPREYLPVPNKREMWCQRTRTYVPMMTEEDYAIFISMED